MNKNNISIVIKKLVILFNCEWSRRHTNDIATQLNKVNLIKLQSYSPKLNPLEQVWS